MVLFPDNHLYHYCKEVMKYCYCHIVLNQYRPPLIAPFKRTLMHYCPLTSNFCLCCSGNSNIFSEGDKPPQSPDRIISKTLRTAVDWPTTISIPRAVLLLRQKAFILGALELRVISSQRIFGRPPKTWKAVIYKNMRLLKEYSGMYLILGFLNGVYPQETSLSTAKQTCF